MRQAQGCRTKSPVSEQVAHDLPTGGSRQICDVREDYQWVSAQVLKMLQNRGHSEAGVDWSLDLDESFR
jgi:hypothetical protein